MSKPHILLIEGKRTDHPSFAAGLTKKGYLVESVPSGAAALAQLDLAVPNLIVVDASSMRTNGKRIVQALRQKQPGLALILVIDSNSDPNDHYDADVILVLPFTMQKLINRIRHLLPGQNNYDLVAGPISLDVAEKRVTIGDRQARLTPRLTILLKILAARWQGGTQSALQPGVGDRLHRRHALSGCAHELAAPGHRGEPAPSQINPYLTRSRVQAGGGADNETSPTQVIFQKIPAF